MINVSNISVRYGDKLVLKHVSFSIMERRIIALVGANGAGKTTLMRTINGAVRISSGAVEVDGTPIQAMSRSQIARRLTVVAQENETRFPISVLEFVLSGRFAFGGGFGWESSEDLEAANQALFACDLKEYAGRNMNELSGGERQRVVLARALATNASTMLLDEPTANLDLSHQSMMFQLVRDRCQGSGSSALMITHDLNLASEFADEVIMLHEGRIMAIGDPEVALNTENIRRVFGVSVLLDRNPASGKVRVTTVY